MESNKNINFDEIINITLNNNESLDTNATNPDTGMPCAAAHINIDEHIVK